MFRDHGIIFDILLRSFTAHVAQHQYDAQILWLQAYGEFRAAIHSSAWMASHCSPIETIEFYIDYPQKTNNQLNLRVNIFLFSL
jgi:hypothetical protein